MGRVKKVGVEKGCGVRRVGIGGLAELWLGSGELGSGGLKLGGWSQGSWG